MQEICDSKIRRYESIKQSMHYQYVLYPRTFFFTHLECCQCTVLPCWMNPIFQTSPKPKPSHPEYPGRLRFLPVRIVILLAQGTMPFAAFACPLACKSQSLYRFKTMMQRCPKNFRFMFEKLLVLQMVAPQKTSTCRLLNTNRHV